MVARPKHSRIGLMTLVRIQPPAFAPGSSIRAPFCDGGWWFESIPGDFGSESAACRPLGRSPDG